MAIEFLFTAATQAPDRLIIANTLTRVALAGSPRWQEHATQVRGRSAALRRSIVPRRRSMMHGTALAAC